MTQRLRLGNASQGALRRLLLDMLLDPAKTE